MFLSLEDVNKLEKQLPDFAYYLKTHNVPEPACIFAMQLLMNGIRDAKLQMKEYDQSEVGADVK